MRSTRRRDTDIFYNHNNIVGGTMMKKTFPNLLTLALVVLIAGPFLVHGQTFVINLKGKTQGFLRDVPAPDGGQITDAICFEVPLFDVPTGMNVGVGLDCLSDIVDDGDGGVTLTDTTIFDFKENGTLVSQGRVSIRPIKDTESAPASTHVTGSIPSPGTKTIITSEGTELFQGRTGAVRLSGAVNMSEFNLNPGEPIDFDCLFVIKVDDDSSPIGDVDVGALEESSADEPVDLAPNP